MWPNLIKHLQDDAELTQAQIADRVGCSQPTIHRLLSGETLDPSFSVGVALIDFAKKLGAITREDLRPDIFRRDQPATPTATPVHSAIPDSSICPRGHSE